MSDLAAKQEALDPDLIGFDGRGNITLPRKAFETVHAAARSHVRLVSEGPDYEAAEAALLAWGPTDLSDAEVAHFVVDAALADYLTEGDA